VDPVPPSLARRGGLLTRLVGRAMLRLLGWRVEGTLPDRERIVAVVAPHSTYLDFLVAIGLVFSWNLRVRFIGKKELFRFPLRWTLTWLGGIPVDRAASRGFVDQVAAEIDRGGKTLLGIAPEGTRTFRARWKTGFYRIARQTNAAIVPVCLDWRRRVIGILPEVPTTGDAKADLERIVAQFTSCTRRDGRLIDPVAAVADGPAP
jgi:1-acyl-sn-glycerol-3-phosphate acyltransferase